MKIENTEVFGFKSALRGMRNPMDSWNRNDSVFYSFSEWLQLEHSGMWDYISNIPEMPVIGPKDMKLATSLIKAGPEHRKFLRQIMIWVDFTLPRYILTELDTYKVSTVRNSCSTMHKLGYRDLCDSDFEDRVVLEPVLLSLNEMGKCYRNNKNCLWSKTGEMYYGNDLLELMKQNLPEGFLQKITYTMNYETALSMYFQRRNHRLKGWKDGEENSICSWIRQLPYMNKFIECKQ